MRLTTRNAASYLIGRRLLDADAVVNGGFLAHDASRRNRNIKVRFDDGRGLFLKQTPGGGLQEIMAMQREAVCYDMLRQCADLAPVRAIAPTLRFHDPGANILTLDLIADGESLYLYHQRTREYPSSIAVALGGAMALLHSPDVAAAAREPERTAIFPRTPPWILSLDEMQPAALGPGVSPANRQLIELVHRFPGFGESLRALRAEWSTDSLMHGDMKWDNCVLTWPNGGDAPCVTFVDWELADLGDACWDVGAILQAYLSAWIASIPEAAGASPADLERAAATPLATLQPAMRDFWERYAERRELPVQDRAAILDRCVRSAGARMIQTAYESLAFAQQLTASMILLVQVSLNILARPRDAAAQLLAFRA